MEPGRLDVVREAQRIADEVLFPNAVATDRAGVLPRENLDALAAAGLYGLAGPPWAGGLDADFATVCEVTEIVCGGCLTTGFVWTQHHGAVRAVAGHGAKVTHQPLPQGDPKQRCPDITRARTLLGWEPKIFLEEGLQKTFEYFRATRETR